MNPLVIIGVLLLVAFLYLRRDPESRPAGGAPPSPSYPPTPSGYTGGKYIPPSTPPPGSNQQTGSDVAAWANVAGTVVRGIFDWLNSPSNEGSNSSADGGGSGTGGYDDYDSGSAGGA